MPTAQNHTKEKATGNDKVSDLDPNILLTISKTARLLNISPSTLRRLESEKKINSIRKPNGHRVFNITDIEVLKASLDKKKKAQEEKKILKKQQLRERQRANRTASEEGIQSRQKAAEKTPNLAPANTNSDKYPQAAPPQQQRKPSTRKVLPTTEHTQQIWQGLMYKGEAPRAKKVMVGKVLLGTMLMIVSLGILGITGPHHIKRQMPTNDAVHRPRNISPNSVLGIADKLTAYIFRLNVPSIFEKSLQVKETLTVEQLATLTGGIETESITFTTPGIINNLLAINDVTETTLEQELDIAGDISGESLQDVKLSDEIEYSGDWDFTGTWSIDGEEVAATADELNALEGIETTADELNILSGVTATAAELNTLDGVTSNVIELNVLDGATLTAAELNVLDGITSNVTELNYLDGATVTAGGLLFGNGTNFTQNAASLFWDDTNNRLGIGTTAPSYLLDVAGTGFFSSQLMLGADITSYGSPTLGNRTYTNDYYVTDDQTFTASVNVLDQAIAGVVAGTAGLWQNAGSYIYADSTTNDDVVITDTGSVGVGTTAPLATLHINGGTGSLSTGLAFGDGNTGFYENSDNVLAITANGATNLYAGQSSFSPRTTGKFDLITDEISSATNPVYVFWNDADTGIGRAKSDVLSLIAGGTNGLNINSSGNVGIGTTAPSDLVTIKSTQDNLGLTLTEADSDYTAVKLGSYGSGGYIQVGAGGNVYHNITAMNHVTFNQTGLSWMDFTVEGNTDTRLLFADSGEDAIGMGYASLAGTTGKLLVNGNVGIGTTAPAAQLHLAIGNTSSVGQIVQATAGQTADLQEWQDSSGNVLSGIDERGILFSNGNTQTGNVFIGNNTGNASASGDNNIVMGSRAGEDITTGYSNVVLGQLAGLELKAGTGNILLGSGAGRLVSTGSGNILLGTNTGDALKTGTSNVGIGATALRNADSAASGNVAIGTSALQVQDASNAVAIGYFAGLRAKGGQNVFIGYESGKGVTDSTEIDGNTLIGFQSGLAMLTGADDNTLIGDSTGKALTTGASNVLIGHDAGATLTTGSNLLYIENSNSATPLLWGNFDSDLLTVHGSLGVGTTAPTSALDVRGEIKAPKINKVVIVDGVTYPQTCAGINSAIDELGSNGGEVYLPEGTYTCAVNITMDYAYTTIRGAGVKTNINASGASLSPVINLNNQSYLTFKNFKVTGSAGGSGGDIFGGSTISYYTTFEDLFLFNADDEAINLNTCSYVTIRNTHINNSDGYGIYLYNVDNSVITGNRFTNGDSYAINARGDSDRLIIQGNTFDTDNLYFYSSSNNTIVGNTFISAGISNNNNSDTYSGYTITGNAFYGSGSGTAISIDNFDYATVTGNSIDNYTTGISVNINGGNGATSNLISNNSIANSTTGISIGAGTSNTTLSYNKVENNTTNISDSGTDTQITHTANGNLGIGTTSPSYLLDVAGSLNTLDLFIDGALMSSSGAELSLLDGATATAGGILFGDGTKFTQDVTNLFWDDSNDRLGLGTTSPTAQLHLAVGSTASIGQKIQLASGATANAFEINSSSGVGGDLFMVDSGGDVGIGTTSPNARLEVAKTFTDTSGSLYSGYFYNRTQPSGASSAYNYGLFAGVQQQNANDTERLFGIKGAASISNSNAAEITEVTAVHGTVDVEDATVTRAYGGYFYTPTIDSGELTTGYGIRINQGVAGGGTYDTQYNLYLDGVSNATNNYGIWGNGGDWVLDTDGDGVSGGTSGGGDIFLGEGQDLELYHNGTNSFIINNTGDLYIGDSGTDDVILSNNGGRVGIGTTNPTSLLHVADDITLANSEYIDNSVDGTILLQGAGGPSYNRGLNINLEASYLTFDATDGTIAFQDNARFLDGINVDTISQSGGSNDVLIRTVENSKNIVLSPHSAGDVIASTDSDSYLVGSTTSGGDLYLAGTTNATTGDIFLNPVGGNVGIGTTNPTSLLEIAGNGATDATSSLHITDSAGNASLFVRDDRRVGIKNNSPRASLDVRGQGQTSATYSMILTDSAYDHYLFTVRDDGEVGIGTNNPDTDLHLVGMNGTSMLIEDTELNKLAGINLTAGTMPSKILQYGPNYGSGLASALVISAAKDFRVATEGTEALRINNAGDVGIGIDSPTAQLHLSVGSTASVGQKIQLASGATANALEINSSGGIGGDLLVVDSSGNVGVGTTNPEAEIEVEGSNATIRVDGTNPSLEIDGPSNGQRNIEFQTAGTPKWRIGMTDSDKAGSGAEFFIGSQPGGGNAHLWIEDVSGYVGLGATSPTAQLHLAVGSTAVVGQKIQLASGATANAFEIDSSSGMGGDLFVVDASGNVGIGRTAPERLFNLHGTANAYFTVTNDDAGTSATDGLLVGINTSEVVRFINYEDTDMEFWTDGDQHMTLHNSGGLSLGNAYVDTDPGANSVIVEGNVGVGTTDPGEALHVIGNAQISAIASAAYDAPVNQTSDGTLTTATSDIRFKENIVTIDNALDKVLNLRGVNFTWIGDATQRQRLGLIAQEVAEISPELVFQNPVDDYYGVYYGETSALLIEAVKEQQLQISLHEDMLETMTLGDAAGTELTVSVDDHSTDTAEEGMTQTLEEIAQLQTDLEDIRNNLVVINELLTLEDVEETTQAVSEGPLAQMTELADDFKAFVTALGLRKETDEEGNNMLTVETDMNVLANATFNNVTITGNLSLGTIEVDTLANSINVNGPECYNDLTEKTNEILCEMQTLSFQRTGAGNVDFFGGKVLFSPEGNLSVEGTVAAAKIVADDYAVRGEAETIGEGTILIGQTEIVIPTAKVTETSKVFITPKGSTAGQTMYVVEKVAGESFTVAIDDAVNSNIEFDWFIISVETEIQATSDLEDLLVSNVEETTSSAPEIQ
jgi:DNA-binding transcriptional MerR regulator